MEDPTQPPSEHSANSAREKLRSYLGSQMKVVISDGRVLIGEFMCTDKERNLILGNCDEYIPTNEAVEVVSQQESLSRMLSLAIIPGHHISSIAVATGKSGNEALTATMKHAQYKSQHNNHQKSQDKNQHDDQHEGEHQHENHNGDQHENHHGDQNDVNQHDDDQHDNNKHENPHEDQNDDQNDDNQHGDDNQHEDQNDKKLGNKNEIDAYTEEYGQTREDSHTPQQHLTLQ